MNSSITGYVWKVGLLCLYTLFWNKIQVNKEITIILLLFYAHNGSMAFIRVKNCMHNINSHASL